LVAHLLAGTPYYLGGLWGLTHHRLTMQQYVAVLDVFVKSRRRSRTLGHARAVFHVLRPKSFEYGITAVALEGVAVNVSDAERTVLDLLDYPEVAGGLLPALDLVRDSLPRVDLKKLVEYAVRGSRLSTCQRLGVLLERAGTPSRALSPLRRRLRTSSSRLSMVPGQPRRGPLNVRWNVVENDRAGDQR
jgi:predicted transcriptional regulator of viral defense system